LKTIHFAGIILDNNARLLPPPPSRCEKLNSSGTRSRRPKATKRRSSSWRGRHGFPSPTSIKALHPLSHGIQRAVYDNLPLGRRMYCDWQGKIDGQFPDIQSNVNGNERTKWDFKQWVPDVVVVCLGLTIIPD